MYAGDLAQTISYCIANDVAASFNVAVDENLTIRELAEITLKACGEEGLELRFDQTSPDGQYRKDVSNALMKEYLPDFEFTPLEVGIKRVYAAYKNNISI